MRKELNDYEDQIKYLTGLSIPRFAHIRNRAKCNDCKKWFKATKYLPKEMAEENKYESCFDENPQPIILCGKCGVKYFSKADIDSDFFEEIQTVKRFKRSIGKEDSSFKLGCENCPIGKSACNRDPFFEPCDSKLLRWFKSKPRT